VAGAAVSIGGAAATDVNFVNATTLTATTPAGTAGAHNVVVTNPDTQTGTLVNGFTYILPAPTVTGISPISGSTSGGTAVNIAGANFVAGATVSIGGAAATGVTFINANNLTATTPAGTAGAQNVVVTNPDAQFGSLIGGFTYVLPAPTTTGIVPASGTTAGGTPVTITGTHFVAGAAVTIGGAEATNVVFVNATSITATTPAGTLGVKDVVVTNPDGQLGTLAGGFTYTEPVAPIVTGINPNSGPVAGGTAVTITGTNFVAGATVTIGGVAAMDFSVVSATSITATTPAGTLGAKDVVVTNPDTLFGTLPGGFTYIEGALISGYTHEVNGAILPGVTITLDGGTSIVSDSNGFSASTLGNHTLIASKAGFRNETQIIDVTDLSAPYTVNFKGVNGLVPNAPNMSYVLSCVNKWKYPPSDGTALTMSKVLSVVNAWKYPLS
jgi:hypothetical protein